MLPMGPTMLRIEQLQVGERVQGLTPDGVVKSVHFYGDQAAEVIYPDHLGKPQQRMYLTEFKFGEPGFGQTSAMYDSRVLLSSGGAPN